MVCIISFCWSYKLSNTKSMCLNGGSYLAMYGNKRVLDIYNTRPSTDPIFKVFEKLDYDIFEKQIEAVNKYCKNGDSTLKIFIVPDIHGSLIEAFDPLIRANIIKENSLADIGNVEFCKIDENLKNINSIALLDQLQWSSNSIMFKRSDIYIFECRPLQAKNNFICCNSCRRS